MILSKKIYDIYCPEDTGFIIPNIVYQTSESKKLSKFQYKEISKFRTLNPQLSWTHFDSKSRENYMKDFWCTHPIFEIFKNARFGVMKADIFRYCIVYERGGYYFDTTKMCVQPLRSFHKNNSHGILTFENNYYVHDSLQQNQLILGKKLNLIANWGFGFSEKHEFLRAVLDSIVLNYSRFKSETFQNPKIAILELTGPIAFTRVFLQTRLIDDPYVEKISVDFGGTLKMPASLKEQNTIFKKHYSKMGKEKLFQGRI